jgi:hypothetical protein
MDAEQFDTLARSLTKGRSRRGALAAGLGGALGVLVLANSDEIEAASKAAKRRKKKAKSRVNECLVRWPQTKCHGCDPVFALGCANCQNKVQQCCPQAKYSWDAACTCFNGKPCA